MKRMLSMLLLPALACAQAPTMLKDLSPGNASSALLDLKPLPNNHVLFGAACNPASLSGLYASDGSTAGTHRVASFSVGSNIAIISSQGYVGGTNSTGSYIFRTDGSVAGTDSVLLGGMSGITSLVPVNGLVVAVAAAGSGAKVLWRSDGTAAGTYSLLSCTAVQTYSVVNNVLYFSGTTSMEGAELYRTDGTSAGTYMLKDVWSGGGSGISTSPVKAVVGNYLYFLANDGASGGELWRTDGTTGGTLLLKGHL